MWRKALSRRSCILSASDPMRIAVEGCCHGELDNIYATLEEVRAADRRPVDLLLICGDFQAIRNQADLLSLAVPEKYRQLGGFHRYYSGEKTAPVLTIVIGGNHEASNYMWELFHGGWVAPNIYYLGAAGSVLVNGLRICGASGIYKSQDYRRGRFETLPYDNSSIRSTYHTREYDISRLSMLPLVSAWPTIVLSHDWPLEIARFGDTAALLRRKPFFRDEVNSNTLGSPPLRGLLDVLKPAYWFAAHLHVKFSALYKHDGSRTQVKYPTRPVRPQSEANEEAADGQVDTSMDDFLAELEKKEAAMKAAGQTAAAATPTAAANPDALDISDEDEDLIHPEVPKAGLTDVLPANGIDESVAVMEKKATNPDEIDMNDLSDEEAVSTAIPAPANVVAPQPPQASAEGINSEAEATRFLALSKCLPGQDFLQVLEIATPDALMPGEAPKMTFDPTWLAISRAFQPLLSLRHQQPALPSDPTILKATIEKELAWIRKNVPEAGAPEVASIQKFEKTAPPPNEPGGDARGPGSWYTNPQTEAFCRMLGVENKVNPVPPEFRQQQPQQPQQPQPPPSQQQQQQQQ